jgi:hypothetical protein
LHIIIEADLNTTSLKQNARLHEWPTGPFMEPCGGPSIATPPFFVVEASGVPWKLETEKSVQ